MIMACFLPVTELPPFGDSPFCSLRNSAMGENCCGLLLFALSLMFVLMDRVVVAIGSCRCDINNDSVFASMVLSQKAPYPMFPVAGLLSDRRWRLLVPRLVFPSFAGCCCGCNCPRGGG